MLDVVLSANERQEAALVLDKYRKKYMCGMGPVLVVKYAKAIESDAGREQFAKATELFFNSTYFSNASNDGLPQNTRDLLGFEIWQSPCKLEHVKRLDNSQILTGFVSGNINAKIDTDKIDKTPAHLDFFVKGKDEKDRDILVYPYNVECVFSNVEQPFMFLRAFWYYIEARVLLHLVGSDLNEGVSHALEQYTECRRSLILPFVYDKFPERQYYTQVNVTKASEVEFFYDKHLFSKIRMVQRKALIIARVISRGENEEKKDV
jgi:hypothetical protein